MWFEEGEIKQVRQHVVQRAKNSGAILLTDDYDMFSVAMQSIVDNKQRKYNPGEPLTLDDAVTIKSYIKKAIQNSANATVEDVKKGKNLDKHKDSAQNLLILSDYFYIVAMQRLGCPDMPVFAFDTDVKNTIIASSLRIDRIVNKYDISKEKEFKAQRRINAGELEARLKNHQKGIEERKDKPQHVGELIAEYQALTERQSRHGWIWRLFHKTENQARTELLGRMAQTIKKTMEGVFPKETYENLDALNPSDIARTFADARIRGIVEIAGKDRLISKTKQIFGTLDVDNKNALLLEEAEKNQKKEPLANDVNFISEVNGKETEVTKPLENNERDIIIAKDNSEFSLFD